MTRHASAIPIDQASATTTPSASAGRDWLFIGLVCGGWSVFALLISSQWYLGLLPSGRPLSWWRIFGFHLLAWNLWSLLTPVVLRLAQRFPLTRAHWTREVARHSTFALGLALVQVCWFSLLYRLINPTQAATLRRLPGWGRMLVENLREYIPQDLLIYWAILGVGAALHYYQRYREREFRAKQLEAQLAQAQLQALRMQLHPHFLFNTLHSIAALVRNAENDAAVGMIAGLSDLLRHSLENAGQPEVRLREELQFIERYLEIQQRRFADRLTIELQIAPETLDAWLPNLLLQPLVENAIQHGVSRRSAGQVSIQTARENGWLSIQIYNDGVALPADWHAAASPGVGLSNTQARLQQLYGTAQRFELRNEARGGVTAKLQLPWRTT